MRVQLITPPTLEPITLAQLKLHIYSDSGSFGDNMDSTQSLAPGVHVVADNYTTHAGAYVEVLGYAAVVLFESGTNLATGTVDVKIQESDDHSTWTDWATGAFTQVTTANDNATYEKEYTGTKRYIRTVAKVLVANCEFGTSIVRSAPTSAQDDVYAALIQTAREHVEDVTRRALLTQTWDYFLDRFPSCGYIDLPFGNLQTVTHIKYRESGWLTTADDVTMALTTDYLVETNGEGHGRIVLPYGVTWPSPSTYYTSNPITIRFVCGWTSQALIPSKIKTAIKFLCADMNENRGDAVLGQTVVENKVVDRLLASARLWGNFA